MHFPIIIETGSVKILLHAILEPLGMFIGFRYFLYLRKRNGDQIESGQRLWILIGAIFGALLGSRLVGGLENPAELIKAPNPIFYFYANKTIVGGFLGGLFGVELVKKFIGEKQSSGDLFTYPLILALIIGRIGCFSMGVFEETYGIPTNFFTGMNLGDGIKRHPVILYEIFFLLLVWISMKQVEKKYVLAGGAGFKIFMIAYLFFRLVLDFIKPHYTFNFGLSTIQLVCIAGLLYYGAYILKPKKLILQPDA
ncbi:MAG: prolipoprotein diacylglyceryl transferase [Ferruginibacter sp.]|nr:prolipoprotein diacylglyceryl transferase [Ferruginibacter sp.]